MSRKVIYLFFIIIFIPNARLFSTIITDNDNYSPEDLVNILLGSCVNVSNIRYTGNVASIGYFSNGGSLGISQGVLLTTGSTDVAVGPNNASDASYISGQSGDASLEQVTCVTNTQDVSMLEFDFIPITNVITFRYVFASEEYPEYGCSAFNDVFAFMVSGPGYSQNTNIALIPSTSIPVAINTVNSGSPGANASGGTCSPGAGNCPPGSLSYSNRYNDNTGGTNVQYDGYTDPLTATINVTPCQSYHIKLAIADVGDPLLDSGVFIEAESFSGGQQVTVTASSDVREGCSSLFTFTRSVVNSSSQTVNFTVS